VGGGGQLVDPVAETVFDGAEDRVVGQAGQVVGHIRGGLLEEGA